MHNPAAYDAEGVLFSSTLSGTRPQSSSSRSNRADAAAAAAAGEADISNGIRWKFSVVAFLMIFYPFAEICLFLDFCTQGISNQKSIFDISFFNKLGKMVKIRVIRICDGRQKVKTEPIY